MIAKDLHLLASSYEYEPPNYTDVRLDSLFLVFFATDSVLAADSSPAPGATLNAADVATATEFTSRLTRIDSAFSDFVSDLASIVDGSVLEVEMDVSDNVRMGDGASIHADIEDEDAVSVEERVEMYRKDYGRKWGMLVGAVTPYQEKK